MGAGVPGREQSVYPRVEVWDSIHADDAARSWLNLGPGEGAGEGSCHQLPEKRGATPRRLALPRGWQRAADGLQAGGVVGSHLCLGKTAQVAGGGQTGKGVPAQGYK